MGVSKAGGMPIQAKESGTKAASRESEIMCGGKQRAERQKEGEKHIITESRYITVI